MIITVTMNPAIDKTVQVKQLQTGALNRLEQVEQDAGGKGINVSKTIASLGGESIACGFLGLEGSEQIVSTLQKADILCDFVMVDGRTRTNLKVMEEDGTLTELNEPGMYVSKEAVEQLKSKLISYANEHSIFVLSGSIPKGVETTMYGELITLLQEKKAKVFLDADGILLQEAIGRKPDFVKPNEKELQQLFGENKEASEALLIHYAVKLIDMGIPMFSISRGADGALFYIEGKLYQCPGLKVELKSSVGAGDAMVAAFAYALDQNLSTLDCVKLAMATSAGAVSTIGTKPPAKELVMKLKEQVEILQIEV